MNQNDRNQLCRDIGNEVGLHMAVVSGLLYMGYTEEEILAKYIRVIDVRIGILGILEFCPC